MVTKKTVQVSLAGHNTLRRLAYEQNKPIFEVLEEILARVYGPAPDLAEVKRASTEANGDT